MYFVSESKIFYIDIKLLFCKNDSSEVIGSDVTNKFHPESQSD